MRILTCALLLLTFGGPAHCADILFMQQGGNPDFDFELIDYIESLGHTVTAFDTGVELPDDQFDAAEAHDLVYITESLGSGTTHDGVETWIKESSTPQIWAEAYAWDEAAITGDIQFEDFGNTQRQNIDEDPEEEFNEGQTTLHIVNDAHPLAGGLKGEVQVYEEEYSLNWALTESLGEGAEVVASVDPDGVYATLFAYPQGSKLEDETESAGIRIGFWLGQAGLGAPVFENLHPNGLVLIEAAINYGLGATSDPCDLDGDGSLGIGDISMLAAGITSNSNDAALDLSQDGQVSFDDLKTLVTSPDKMNSYIGDANLDGEFSSADLVKVFQAGLFESGADATWEQGDFNGDSKFTSSDFVVAFQDGGFELGPRVAAPVPEPNGILLISFGVLALIRSLRRQP